MILVYFIASIFFLLCLIFWFKKRKKISWNQALTQIGVLLAIFVSIFNSYGKALLPFSLKEVVPGGIFIFRFPEAENKSPLIVLPINFSNRGYGSGIVQYVFIEIVDPAGNKHLYRPNFDIDTNKLISEDFGSFKANSIKEVFQPFVLDTLETTNKNILFQDNESYDWVSGTYTFNIFAKLSNKDYFIPWTKFEFTVREDNLRFIRNGTLYYEPINDYGDMIEEIMGR